MKGMQGRRRLRVLAGRGVRAARNHAFSLLSGSVLCALAAIALSNDAFQTSRPRAQVNEQLEAIELRAPADGLAQYALGLAWIPPASGADPRVAAAYFGDVTQLTPLERARLRPRRPLPASDEPFQVSLIDATPQEQAEALLTAMRDAEALGLRLQVAD